LITPSEGRVQGTAFEIKVDLSKAVILRVVIGLAVVEVKITVGFAVSIHVDLESNLVLDTSKECHTTFMLKDWECGSAKHKQTLLFIS
jgi:hypothetical protein